MGLETSGKEGYAPFDLYPYNPEQAPAFAFLGLFGAVAIAHLAAMIPYRSIFPLPLVIGCGSKCTLLDLLDVKHPFVYLKITSNYS